MKRSSKPSSKVSPSANNPRGLLLTFAFVALGIWAIYVNFGEWFSSRFIPTNDYASSDSLLTELANMAGLGDQDPAVSLGQMTTEEKTARLVQQLTEVLPDHQENGLTSNSTTIDSLMSSLPVLGPVPTDGIQPLFKMKHQGGDAIFALACNYPKLFYQRFVGSLRKSGYEGDIVLAVSPIKKMKPGVEKYLKQTKVLSYAFDVDCIGKDNCKLRDDFLGYPDPRPHRTFANIRYALYEYWLQYYSAQSYILILDFRDTFFQKDPFEEFGPVKLRKPNIYDLKLYAENAKVKSIGNCVYNSLWIGRCFGKPALAELKNQPVLCSGSTLGSFIAIKYYVRTMLRSMDTVKCWLKGIESDQGYQNYLFYHGHFNPPAGIQGNVTAFQQGDGIVNTIGAMNGKRLVCLCRT
jgi:hypothetical protein